MDTLVEITKGVLEGRLSLILPTAAGGRAPLRIRVVRPVPIELRLALVEPQIRDLVVAVARAPTGITASHPQPPKIELYFPLEADLYALTPELNTAAGRVGTQATRAGKQQVVAKISLHTHDDHDRHDSGKFTENSGFRRLRTVIRSTVAYSQLYNIETFGRRQGVDNSI